MATVYELDPLRDSRWPKLLEQHRRASVFHTPEWLTALRATYGYRPSAVTLSAPGEDLTNALPFCRVESWLTGKRIVSVPFSDHVPPLVDNNGQLACLLSRLKDECNGCAGKYVEVRDTEALAGENGFAESERFHEHWLDLHPTLDDLYKGLHASCIRRRLSKAERAGFQYEEGRSEVLLQHFYKLALLTRRRQLLPPQPLMWFRNLIQHLGDRLVIRLLFHSGVPAAGILTLRFGDTMTYKYGFSDQQFHHLGSMQLLLWTAIQDAKKDGLAKFDMGRSEWGNETLAVFKDRWGCTRSSITYARYPAVSAQGGTSTVLRRVAGRVLASAPDSVLTTAGNLVYRHMG